MRLWLQRPASARAKALRRFMLAMMAEDQKPCLANPKLWAPFVVAGEDRANAPKTQ
jgi:CHAT domain-containing protein